ncbi:DUF2267 domain-containing protein [Halorarum salinum]|uniref:DUF2267 domain-containing protein n=1 Tax=Halorarum salinum TaxID=2743089 RepID=A0A7D5L8N4_9EURY|nr:DUF2267 domain-containing protein [Halobaculum salinum]QLG60946.1 DUF2267 domain-containing protein [Halobaculum salinum]
MDYDTFVGEVQNRARLPSREDALRATRITLEPLGRRVDEGVAGNLAAQLPEEIGRFLAEDDATESFEWDGFVDRVVEAGEYGPEDDRGEAVHHARVVLDVVDDAVTTGAIEDLRDQIAPADDWNELFALVDQEEKPVEGEQRSE